MAHDNDVAVTGQHPRRVVQGLSLGEGKGLDFRRLPHLAAEQVERTAEGDARSRTGLEKHAGEDRAFENAGDSRSARVRFHLVRDLEQAFDIVPFELIDGEYVLADEIQGGPPWSRDHTSWGGDFHPHHPQDRAVATAIAPLYST